MATHGEQLRNERAAFGTFEEYATRCLEIGAAPELVVNPYSGNSCMLEPLAVAVHDTIKGLELYIDHDEAANEMFCEALSWFHHRYPDAYYVLLD
jgi:hypothetical protein